MSHDILQEKVGISPARHLIQMINLDIDDDSDDNCITVSDLALEPNSITEAWYHHYQSLDNQEVFILL